MTKKRVRLSSDIPEIHKKEKAKINLNFPKSIQMKYIGYDPRILQHQQPTFQGQIRIPIKLHAWISKTNYGKNHKISLKLDKLDHNVGIAPFSVNIRTLGHYFESNIDVEEDLVITIDTWLMSPELLDSAILEFSITLVGEEKVSERVFRAPNSEKTDNSPQLPVWSVSHIPFKFKLKLIYDTREFERAIIRSFDYYAEEIRIASTKHEFQPDFYVDPTIIPVANIEILQEAKYLSKQGTNAINNYLQMMNIFHKSNPYSKYKSSINDFKNESSEFSKRLFKKLNIFEKIIKTYEKISLKKLATFLDIRDIERLEVWLLSLREDYPIKLQNKIVFFDLRYTNNLVTVKNLDQLFLEYFFLSDLDI